ncbi:MAG: peptidylprolyl isomerase [Blastococcus sp.]
MLVSGFLLTVAVSGLTGCRTSPNVAAYVGDEQVTVAELDAAVAERLEDPDIAAYADGQEEEFTRQVLTLLVQEEVHAAAAERFDVQVDDDEVRRRLTEAIGDRNSDQLYQQVAAEQGASREDVFQDFRQAMVRQEIAEQEGKAEGPSEEALQARYDEVRESLAEYSFGYITVPDDATATAVLTQLTANPAAYPAVAAQYPGTYTLAALETRSPDSLPAPLADGVAAAEPNTGFSLAVPETGGVVVTFVAGKVYPDFEELRPQLEAEAAAQASQAGVALVDEVRSDIGVTVNPRYGVLKDGELVSGDGGVVDILGGDASPQAGAAEN